MRVESFFAESIQQIHSFLASGVRPFQTASVAVAELRASRRSAGALCTGPGLGPVFSICFRSYPRVERQALFAGSGHQR